MTSRSRRDVKLKAIRDHWEQAAKAERDQDGLRPTARDPYLQEVIESTIEKRLRRGTRLLDVGCGDGQSTLRFARTTGQALGVDLVEGYVERARRNASSVRASNVQFERADVLDLAPIRARFGQIDVVTTIRCLINLPDWDCQALALEQIAACIAPSGLYIASEGWLEGLQGLDRRRRRVGLPVMEVAEYNRFLSRFDFEREAEKYFDIMRFDSVGLYLFLSRVFQPKHVAPDQPSHAHPINRTAAEMQAGCIEDEEFLDCDYAGVYVLRRKS